MRHFIRDHFARVVAILVVLATLLGGVAVLVPDINKVLSDHPGLGWGAAFAFGCTAVYVWMLYDREAELVRSNKAASAQHLEAAVADAVRTHATKQEVEVDRLRRELAVAREQNLHAEDIRAQLEAHVTELQGRLGPSARDIAQFATVQSAIPLEKGTMPWLRDTFSGKSWRDDQVAPLHQVDMDWQEWFFDDPAVDEKFRQFRTKVARLLSWMAIEGGRDHDLEFAGDDRAVYSIADGNTPHRTWPEFDAERDVGTGLADEVVASRRELERTARDRRLDLGTPLER